MPLGNLEVKAQWKVNEYSVKLDAGYGKVLYGDVTSYTYGRKWRYGFCE